MGKTVNLMEVHVVYGWGAHRLAALLPTHCLVCGEAGVAGRDACLACLAALPWLREACPRCALPLGAAERGQVACGACQRRPPPLDAVIAAFAYGWPVDGLLRRFKFHQDLAAGRLLGQLLAERCRQAPRPQALVPLSLHIARLRQRGYDQALELARPLARVLGLPCLPALRRIRATRPQSELDARQRVRNLRGAFAVGIALPAHVALVDDVMTTGASLHAAAHALRKAGVQRVDAWVCARVP
ncbi:MAG: ComF family protein [Pseudomonas sp.]